MLAPHRLLIARFLKTAGHERTISQTFLFCITIIALATCVLTLIISIMQGFETALNKTLQSVQPDILIKAPIGTTLDTATIVPVIETITAVKAVSWQVTEHVLIRSKDSAVIAVALIKGVVPHREAQISTIDQKIVQGNEQRDLAKRVTKNNVLIGNVLAHDLNCTEGDAVELLIPTDFQTKGNKLVLDNAHAIIGGVFKTGLDECDSSLIIADIAFVQELFEDVEPTTIGIALKNPADEQAVIASLKKHFHLPTYSWKELYPALIAAMKLEKYVMLLIVSLLVLLACSTISFSIALLITQKKRDIALLKSLGASSQFITSVFFAIGAIIGCIGTSIGLLLAFITGLLIQKYPLELPDSYIVSHIPVALELSIFVVTFCATVMLVVIASWISCRQINQIAIAKTLRSEYL